ncbi:hypothetical protein [Streptomyces atratus]|nr:hypothetical protein [Streptomyces atratus]MCX5338618.1 hypothetical protein [Streptomyces atratus]
MALLETAPGRLRSGKTEGPAIYRVGDDRVAPCVPPVPFDFTSEYP